MYFPYATFTQDTQDCKLSFSYPQAKCLIILSLSLLHSFNISRSDYRFLVLKLQFQRLQFMLFYSAARRQITERFFFQALLYKCKQHNTKTMLPLDCSLQKQIFLFRRSTVLLNISSLLFQVSCLIIIIIVLRDLLLQVELKKHH